MNNSPSPQSSRRFMDFAPRNNRAKRPVASSTPVHQATAAHSARPATPHTSAPRLATRPVRPTPMSRPLTPQSARPALRSTPQAHLVHEHVEATTIFYPSAKKSTRRAPVDEYLDIETSGLGIIEDLDSSRPTTPDNTSFVLGGQSPFINTDKVDKRPLSPHLPKEKPSAKTKNTYEKIKSSRKSAKPLKSTPTVVSGSASRGNNISLVIAIILTIIFGALVGTFVYLAFFQ